MRVASAMSRAQPAVSPIAPRATPRWISDDAFFGSRRKASLKPAIARAGSFLFCQAPPRLQNPRPPWHRAGARHRQSRHLFRAQ
jgi:hypothetical protein